LTATTFADWSRRFILFHGKRHPRELGIAEVGQFLQSIAVTEKDPLRALAASRDALTFLYQQVLHLDLGELPLPPPPRLLDQARQILRVRHYALSTEECYLQWMTRFILFHNKRHPRDMGAAEVEQFLTHLAVQGHVSASTQNQALNALVFLYAQVLEIDLGHFDAVRARRGKRLPVVLAPEEVARSRNRPGCWLGKEPASEAACGYVATTGPVVGFVTQPASEAACGYGAGHARAFGVAFHQNYPQFDLLNRDLQSWNPMGWLRGAICRTGTFPEQCTS
jgi:hypothetical protein